MNSDSNPPVHYLGNAPVTVSHIYKLTKEQLQKMFDSSKAQGTHQEALTEYGSLTGLIKKLATDANTGIIGDKKDLNRREKVFGKNNKPIPQRATLTDSIKQTASDRLWWVVGGSALFSGICGAFTIEGAEWYMGIFEGVSIILAAMLIIVISSIADCKKDRKFLELNEMNKEEDVAVIRGKFGATQSISMWSLVVGDVVLLSQGSRVPADCIVLTASNLEVAEENDQRVQKFAPPSAQVQGDYPGRRGMDLGADAPGGEDSVDCFLKADSMIMRGMCKALVTVVGKDSSRGDKAVAMNLDIDTPLQKKLKNLAGAFQFGALITAGIIFLLRVVMMSIQAGNLSEDASVTQYVIRGLSQSLNYMVVIAVVSIPEGLPLAVGVSLAFSVMKMHDDKLLVRKLEAPEKMGAVQEILIGKSGTITTANMKVAIMRIQGMEINNTRKDTVENCKLTKETYDLLKQSIIYNTEARVEMAETTYVPVGNATEVSLLKFLQNAEVPVHLQIQRKLGRERCHLPFSPEFRRSAIAVLLGDENDGDVYIYVKGAPETIIELCGKHIVEEGGETDMSPEDKAKCLEDVEKMATDKLRCMSFAYTKMSLDEFKGTFESGSESEKVNKLNSALTAGIEGQLQLTLIGTFGLKDPLRNKVQDCVKIARNKAMLKLRLVSGDHIDTAKSVAKDVGILDPEEYNNLNAVMTGAEFREKIGDKIKLDVDENGNNVLAEMAEEDKATFIEITDNLRVLARATADDKYKLVAGLKYILEKNVSVTGEGLPDREALKLSDVGMTMANGDVAAKEVSSIILTENDFEACLKAVIWGRNIFLNISRFIQFQVTVNISVLVTIFVGTIFFAHSPLNAVQLLWINLIMDTFAALSLSTEPPFITPQSKVMNCEPYTEGKSIMGIDVRAQIYLISLWNIIVMMLVMFCGASLANLNYDRETDPYGGDESDPVGSAMKADKRKHFTYIYNTFVFLQLFNMINCRKIGKKDFNVFEEFFHNMYFLVLFVFIAVVQYLQSNIALFSVITNCEHMERSEWGSCIAVGSTTLLISALIKVIPETWILKLPFIQRGDKLEDTEVKNAFIDRLTALQQAPPAAAPGSALNSEGNMEQQPLVQNDGDDEFKQV